MLACMGYMWKLVRHRTSDSSSLVSHLLLVATMPITSPIQRVMKEILVNNHLIHFNWPLESALIWDFWGLFVCLSVCIVKWIKCRIILKPVPNAEEMLFLVSFLCVLTFKTGSMSSYHLHCKCWKKIKETKEKRENLSPWSLEELSWSTSPHVLSQHWSLPGKSREEFSCSLEIFLVLLHHLHESNQKRV